MKMLKRILDLLKITKPSAPVQDKHPLDIQKYQPEQAPVQTVQVTLPQTIVQETPTPTISSGTETPSVEVTPSEPTPKTPAPQLKSTQPRKKATSAKTKKK